MGFRRRGTILKPSGYDSDAQAYFDELTGVIPDAFKSAINTFILTLKADGNFSLLDRLWLHATPNQQNARVSIVNPTSAQITEVNSPTWTANQGYNGDGATSYLNTNFNASTQGVNYTLNSCLVAIYCRSAAAIEGSDIGAIDGANVTLMQIRRAANIYNSSLNDTAFISTASLSALGFFSSNRLAGRSKQYKNGVLLNDQINAVSAIPNIQNYALGFNLNGVATLATTRQYSITAFGSGSIDQSAFYTSIQTLATTLGFNV